MNSQERVMRTLDFLTPDRIPTSYEFFWPEFVEKWRQKRRLPKEVNINDWYETDLIIECADESFFPSQRKIIKEENGYIFQNDGWGRIIKWRKGADRFQFPAQDVENILEDKRKLDKVNFEPPDLSIRYKTWLSRVKEQKKETMCIL